MRRIMIAVSMLLVLGACAQTPAKVALPPISFVKGAPIKIDAPRIEIVENYIAPLRAPNIEHE